MGQDSGLLQNKLVGIGVNPNVVEKSESGRVALSRFNAS